MTIDEAKTVFLNRGYVEVEGGTIYDADKWRESCRVISEWLEQEPTITSTEDNAEMIYPQVEGITPTVVEPLPDVDKKIESYKKLLKHPVVKHIIGLNEEQEQLDFVQPHKRVPVTLTVSGDLISREAVEEIINDIRDCISVEGYWAILERLKKLPSVKPQEPQTGHWIFDEILDKHYYCSECKSMGVDYWDYCPYCGCRMVEPQESEVQDADKCTYEETGCGSCKMQLNCQKQSQESEDKEWRTKQQGEK